MSNRTRTPSSSRVIPEGKTTCGLCSRLRRGRCTSSRRGELASPGLRLGIIATTSSRRCFSTCFNGGRIKAMSPKLVSDDGRHVVIRPLAYCHERDDRPFADCRQFPIIPCNLCGSQPNLQRQAIKEMLREWERKPRAGREHLSRHAHVSPSHLADPHCSIFAACSRRTSLTRAATSASTRTRCQRRTPICRGFR